MKSTDAGILGKTVSYIRITPEGEALDGIGVVHRTFLDTDKRPQAGVHDGSDQYNIDWIAIDATPEERNDYISHVSAIRAHADAANGKIKEIVEAGNAEIAEMNVKVLGEPLVSLPA